MNKGLKIFISILGGINAAFSIAIPMVVSLLVVTFINLSKFNQWTLIIFGMLSSIYRGLRFWVE